MDEANDVPRSTAILDRLHLNRHSSLSLKSQLSAQIRFAIATGELHPGDRLPSITELAAHLGINRNTVNQVHQDLKAAGFLDTAQGSGVFVAKNSPTTTVSMDRLRKLMAHTFEAAARLGVSPTTLLQCLQSEITHYEKRFPLVAFVECNQYQARDFARQVGSVWKLNVVPLLLSDLQKSKPVIPSTCKVVMTSYFHYPDVRQLVATRHVTVRAVVLDVMTGLKQELARIRRGVKAGIITRFDGVHEFSVEMAAEVRRRGLSVQMFSFEDGNARDLKRFLASIDVLVCPETARDAVGTLGLSRMPRTLEWKATVDLTDLEAVRRSLPMFHAV